LGNLIGRVKERSSLGWKRPTGSFKVTERFMLVFHCLSGNRYHRPGKSIRDFNRWADVAFLHVRLAIRAEEEVNEMVAAFEQFR
jgi:hypothetical protein